MNLSRFKLNGLYNYVMETNPSHNLPYHNNTHLKRVCEFVINSCKYYKISTDDTKIMIISSLFHDYNHSGSSENDDINIKNAIVGIKEYNKISIDRINDDEMEKICSIITSTRYPSITQPNDLLDMIIRDADILQGFFVDNYIEDTVLKIAEENKIPKSVMLDKQPEFLNSKKFYTKWATELFNKKINSLLKSIKNI